MKKWTAVLMALILALAIGCSACADSVDELMAQQEAWLKDSLTTCDWAEKNGERISLEIQPNLEGDYQFQVMVSLSNGALESENYIYLCNYDMDTHKLLAGQVIHTNMVFESEESEPTFTFLGQKDCNAEFELDEEGFLILRDIDANESEDEIYLMGFERVPCDEKGEEISDEIQADFGKEQAGLLGVDYKPLKLLAEDAGRICVLAEAAVVYPGAQPYYALFYIDTTGVEQTGIVLLTDDGGEG